MITQTKFYSVLFTVLLFSTFNLFAQNAAINEDGSDPDDSAILDVKSTSKGVLIPRMTSTQRTEIPSPATGLMVYDTETNSFWFYSGTEWTEVQAGNLSDISDADGDTKIQVEESADEDIVRIDADGREIVSFDRARMSFAESDKLIAIGRVAGNNFNFAGPTGYARQDNIIIGDSAGYRFKNGAFSIIIGSRAGYNGDGTLSENIIIGHEAGYSGSGDDANVYIGHQSGYSGAGTGGNVFVGYQTGYANTNGLYNSFIGYKSGLKNTTGKYNTFLGMDSGYDNISGSYNTFLGHYAGGNNTTADYNTFLGKNAGRVNQTGSYNTFVGSSAAYGNETGQYNVIIGRRGLYNNEHGSQNTILGFEAGYATTSADNMNGNIMIGYQAGYNETGDNKLYIENSNSTTPLIYGEFDNDLLQVNGTLDMNGNEVANIGVVSTTNVPSYDKLRVWDNYNYTIGMNSNMTFGYLNEYAMTFTMTPEADRGWIWRDVNDAKDDGAMSLTTDGRMYVKGESTFASDLTIGTSGANQMLSVNGDINYTGSITDVSDRRLKENLEEVDNVLPKLTQLQAYTYNMKEDGSDRSENKVREYGVMAQDVQKLFPEMVKVIDEENGYLGVSYIQLVPVLLEATKEQQNLITQQQEEIESLQTALSEVENLKAELAEMKQMKSRLAAIEALLQENSSNKTVEENQTKE